MTKIILSLPDRIIEYSFYALFLLIPLILTPFNYELFEYNKMMLTYALTIIIVGAWLIKIIINYNYSSNEVRSQGMSSRLNASNNNNIFSRIVIRRTPLDIPIILFLISQIVSTIFSIDRHVSIWGYYSRFNGGLLSTVSYILLYYAFVSNFAKEKIKRLLLIIFSSAVLVSVYGILEHLGVDKDIWVQDVQNRVFSTLGQPNWLAAYLAVLIPITIGYFLYSKSKAQMSKQIQSSKKQKTKVINILDFDHLDLFGTWDFGFWILSLIFYATLIFTKSRSGFIAVWISLIIFWAVRLLFAVYYQHQSQNRSQMQATAYICDQANKLIGIFIFSFIFITFLFQSPFDQINRFTLPELTKNLQPRTSNREPPTKPVGSSIIDVGITESGKIREIVWKGAIEVFRHFPLTGSGVETFAFAYYKYRPAEHNMTSEWDFLYNKAHNEYLNYAATTGIFGLGSYLLIIIVFIWWNIKRLKVQNHLDFGFDLNLWILTFGLFAGWLSILITNFFGFSVVVIQLFFFLIPAISFVLFSTEIKYVSVMLNSFQHLKGIPKQVRDDSNNQHNLTINNHQLAIISLLLFVICYLLFVITRIWYADVIFANGYRLSRSGEYVQAYQAFKQAIGLNKKEPLYYDELALPAAQLALVFYDEKNATISSGLVEEAVNASTLALNISPNNVNFWKTRTRILFALSQFDNQYLNLAIQSLEFAKQLSPTDPKIYYNLALLYDKLGKSEESIAELVETTKLKPDFRDAYFALAIFYDKNKRKDKARETLDFILTKIATNDAEAKKKLEELK